MVSIEELSAQVFGRVSLSPTHGGAALKKHRLFSAMEIASTSFKASLSMQTERRKSIAIPCVASFSWWMIAAYSM